MAEEETGVALFDEVGHLITVATNAGKSKGESFDKDQTIGLKITRHTKDITHIIISSFFVKRYLTYKMITFDWIVYWIFLRTYHKEL